MTGRLLLPLLWLCCAALPVFGQATRRVESLPDVNAPVKAGVLALGAGVAAVVW
jgi:hypothetical protein